MFARRRLGVSLALSGLLLATVVGNAQASIYDRDHWSDHNTYTGVCGGYVVDVSEWGHWKIEDATAATNGQFFYYTSWYNSHNVVSNPNNGKWFTEDKRNKYQEHDATLLYDDVFAFKGVDVGTYVVRNSKGRIVYRDHGTIVNEGQFDTLGDSAPGGQMLDGYPIEISNTWNQGFDFCAFADRLIGS